MSILELLSPISGFHADDARREWDVVDDFASKNGTPFFLYYRENCLAAFDLFKIGLSQWGNSTIAYSLKTNPTHNLLHDLFLNGSWIEVVSGWEYKIAKNAGFPGDRIIFNGPLKTYESIETAIQEGVFSINIDSIHELEIITKISKQIGVNVPVGIRLCLPKKQENAPLSRFGLQLSNGEVDRAIRYILKSNSLTLRTIHFHLGTQIFDTMDYCNAISIAAQIWKDHKFDDSVWLDIGGGFPFVHNLSIQQQPFKPKSFFATLKNYWDYSIIPGLICEPGRWVSASSFSLITRVIARKERHNEPTIVVLDTGTNHNVMAAFYEHAYSIQDSEVYDETYRYCGCLCMEDDILSGTIKNHIPKIGSLVSMLNAGAYSVSLGRNFIQPIPGLFTVEHDHAGNFKFHNR